MINRVAAVGLSGSVCAILLAVWFSHSPATAQERPAAQNWEYKIVLLEGDDPRANQADFNKLGADAWELCALHSGTRPPFCVFKRPRR
jgi:hypothetical protein